VTSSRPDGKRPPLYPYEAAIANLILLLVAMAAILQPDDLELRPKITGSIALVAVAGLHLWLTLRSGYLPGRADNERLDGGPNRPGTITVLFVVLDVIAVVGVLAS
jgi:hypothetical protein